MEAFKILTEYKILIYFILHICRYIPVQGRLFELDGLKHGPIDLGKIKGSNWLDTVRPVIQNRMQKYSEGEIHFNLMAIVSDQRLKMEKEINALKSSAGKLLLKTCF